MAKNKMVVCKNCNTAIPKKAKVCPHCGVKNKQSVLKKLLIALFVFIAIIAVLVSVLIESQYETIKWDYMELAEVLPTPEFNNGKLKGEVHSDSTDYFSVDIAKCSEDEYMEYVSQCKDAGFIVDSEKNYSSYSAYNKEGYKLSLRYTDYDKEISIELDAPLQLGDINWPENGLGGLLPDPYASVGKIEDDSSTRFFATLGEMTTTDFNDYIDECKGAGFTIDDSKTETNFYAKNNKGYSVTIDYIGFNLVTVLVSEPSDSYDDYDSTNDEDYDTDKTEGTNEKTDNNNLVDGMRPEFKAAMDSYEEFFDEYVEFMEKYSESDGTDLSLLKDYADFMNKYAEYMEEMEKWEDEDLNDAEMIYFVKVQNRINEKLLEVSY